MIVERDITAQQSFQYYEHICWCKNCGERNLCYVQKGNILNGLYITCDKCECEIALKSFS